MSSDYPNYGAVLAKNVKLDQSGLVFHNTSDDTKTVTLKLADSAMSAGNVDVTIPVSATALGASSVPDGDSDGQLLVWNTDEWLQKSVSGDASLAADGALTISAGAVESSMLATGVINNSNLLAAGVVDANALASDSVVSSKIQAGAIDNANKFGAGVVDASALASDACTTVKIQDDAVTNAKIATGAVNGDSCGITTNGVVEASKPCVVDSAKDLTGIRELGAAELQVNNKWKIKQEGNNLIFQYWTGSAWVTKQTFTPA